MAAQQQYPGDASRPGDSGSHPTGRGRWWAVLLSFALAFGLTEAYVIYRWRDAGREPGADRIDSQSAAGTLEAGAAAARSDRSPVAGIPLPETGEGRLPDLAAPLPSTPAEVIDEAEGLAAWMIHHLPDHPDSYELMARVRLWLGDTDRATAYWRKCLQLDPGYVHAYFGMGFLAAEKGEYEKAVELFGKAMAIQPEAPEPRLQMASALINLGEMDEAIALLEERSDFGSRSLTAMLMLGMAYAHRKEYEKARARYEAAVALDPDSADAHYGLARACRHLGQAEEAQEHMKRFEELRAAFRQELRARRRRHHDLDATREELAEVCTIAGQVCEGEGRGAVAEGLWRRAAVLDPRALGCRQALARRYVLAGRAQEAVPVLEELIQLDPRNGGYSLELGDLYAAAGRFDEAEEAYRQVCRIGPQYPHGPAALARLYLKTGRKLAEATALAWQAVERDPSAEHYWLLGQACEKSGDLPGALAAVRQAAARDPKRSEYQEKLQWLQDQMK